MFDNIAFPLRQQKVKKAAIRERVAEAARLLSIEELLTASRASSPAVSGSASRSAARSCGGPKAFLMDEPLSNLDAKLRVQMRAELLSLHQRLGITTIYVTHDQTEAMTLGDRVVVMRQRRRPAGGRAAGCIAGPRTCSSPASSEAPR